VFISFEQSRNGEKGSRKPTEFEPTLPTRQSRSSIGSRGSQPRPKTSSFQSLRQSPALLYHHDQRFKVGNTNDSPKRQTLHFYFPKRKNLSLTFYAADRGQKTYRPKTPRPQRKSFFGELGALCPSTLLLSFESLRTVSHSNGRTTPLRETQFFRSLFHPKFQISLASILRSRYFIWWPWIDAHLKRDNKQRGVA
jgi:hypothetical protein